MTASSKTETGAASSAQFDKRRLSLLWAIQGHAADIARLHAQMFPSPWDEASVLRLLAHPGSIALVAAHGNPSEIGGFALAQVAADEAEILSLGVTGDWRRHGVGQLLLGGIKRAAARGGARSLFLEVAASNASARALYARAGFGEAGRRAGYYQLASGPPEDAIVLRAQLTATAP